MKVLDRLTIAVMRRARRRRREREAADVALPGLEAYMPRERPAEAHTAAHVAAGGKLARPRSVKVAAAAVVVAAGVGVPAYLTGSTVAGAAASEEAEEAALEEAGDEYEAAQNREAAALQAAVAAYSAEREAEGEATPEEVAVQRLQAEHDLSEMEASDIAANGSPAEVLAGQSVVTVAAERMWAEEPPESEEARERIQAYEVAVEEAEAAETEYDAAMYHATN